MISDLDELKAKQIEIEATDAKDMVKWYEKAAIGLKNFINGI